MGERERLAVFNYLGDFVRSARVLDYFAGSGALGLEAFSRGATYVTFVDHHRPTLRTIRHNLDALSIPPSAAALLTELPPPTPYDIIFVDPPYDADLTTLPLSNLHKFLAPSGVIVLSTARNLAIPPLLFGHKLVQVFDKTYARAHLTIWEGSAT
jgi:16S rRNA (guanine966-N2)-methyltransferase